MRKLKKKVRGTLVALFIVIHRRPASRLLVFIPNRTFLVRFGGISGEFGRAMVCILARRSGAKIDCPWRDQTRLYRVFTVAKFG